MKRAFFAALILVLLPSLSSSAPRFSTVSWYQGAEGMQRAIEEAQRTQKPMVVYFRTDWCGYCRQFEEDLLSTEEVGLFMDKLVAVTINPEAGPEEGRIASAYRVRGFPAFFLHPPTLEAPTTIQRMVMQNGKPRLQTPVEFVQTLSRAAHE